MSDILNNLPKVNNVKLIRPSTLRGICDAVRLRRNNQEERYNISNLANTILDTDFGIFFPGGYGGVAIDQGTNLYRKYLNNATMMAPIIGRDVTDCREAFRNCKNLFGNPLMKSDICNSMQATFRDCPNITGEPEIGNNVEDLSFAFYQCSNITGNVPSRDNVTNSAQAFYGCYNLNGYSPNFPNTTNSDHSFFECQSLIGDAYLGDYVQNVVYMYYNCSNLNGNIYGNPQLVPSMEYSFYNCTNLVGRPVSPDNVTNMAFAYQYCYNIVGSAPCGNKVTQMQNAYYDCVNLNGAPIIGPNVTTAINAFYNCHSLMGTPVIYSAKLGSMVGTFYNCTNMTGTVDTPATVTDLRNTFYNCCNIEGIIIRSTNANSLNTRMDSCYIRENFSKRLNVVFSARAIYNYGCRSSVCGCALTAEEVFTEPFNVRLPYTYANGKWYGYKEMAVNRVRYNEEYNIYIYSVQ